MKIKELTLNTNKIADQHPSRVFLPPIQNGWQHGTGFVKNWEAREIHFVYSTISECLFDSIYIFVRPNGTCYVWLLLTVCYPKEITYSIINLKKSAYEKT